MVVKKKITAKKKPAAKAKKKVVRKKVTAKKKPAKKKANTLPVLYQSKPELPPFRNNLRDWDKDAVMEFVCDHLANSPMGLEAILKSVPWTMPNRRTIHAWMDKNSFFDHRYAHAREAQAEFMLDENHEIVRNVGEALVVDGKPLFLDDKPIMMLTPASVALAKLQVDTNKWTMSKLAPKKYGDKIDVSGEVNVRLSLEQAIAKARQERLELQ